MTPLLVVLFDVNMYYIANILCGLEGCYISGIRAGRLVRPDHRRENPPTFKGKYDPDGAQEWLKEIKRIFKAMDYYATQKVRYGTHMLAGEADDWWVGTRQRFTETGAFSKCIKFENGLRPEIKRTIGYEQIRRFTKLVNNCQIYEEENIANSAHYKSLKENRGKPHHDRKKPYDAPAEKGKQKVSDGKKTSEGGAPASVQCYRYVGQGHHFNECENKGHITTQCQKPKKDVEAVKTNGKVFALSGTEDSKKDYLIRGTSFINNIELVAIRGVRGAVCAF
ncbi:uncharacterized protein LOC131650423 [Vicia villosa]|uniref:uncharacterized protein LOC131650423 n=1 Tax=Vicia villosa TaxID=3911 RepID=UPI00273C10F8|nr:uncharacterized protein LOC131650423 [Vicia villosa]